MKDFSIFTKVLMVVAALAVVWHFVGGGAETMRKHERELVDNQVKQEISRINNTVANDFVEQYNIAKRSGNKMDACVAAGFVKAGFLQAKDDVNYQKWTAIEKSDCALCGIQK